jgi:hypothetical protein
MSGRLFMSKGGMFSARRIASGSMLLSASISAPAQNARPAPVSTMTRTSSSRLAAVIASRTSCSMIAVHAFMRSGRLSVMVAILSLTS